jgi:hypothetical protein
VVLDGLPRSPAPRPDGAQVRQLSLPGEPSSVPAARRFVREVLAEWDRPELEEAGTLLASELVSNAVLHARTSVEVELMDGTEVLLVVADCSSTLPVMRRHSRVSATGRGLWLLDQYSLRHGLVVTHEGKQLWSVLRPESTAPGEGDDAALALWLDAIDGL